MSEAKERNDESELSALLCADSERNTDNKIFNKEYVKQSEYPADFIPVGGKVFIGVDEGSQDGDYTVKGFYKDGEFHVQSVERTGT